MNAELILNLWAIYDGSTGFVYGLSGKVYNASGTDEEKLDLLRMLSTTDYLTSKRYELAERFKVISGDIEQSKLSRLISISDPNAQLFKEMFDNLEAELPPIPDFSGLDISVVKQKIPEEPLCIVTILYEDEMGNIRPIVTEEEAQWLSEYDHSLHEV